MAAVEVSTVTVRCLLVRRERRARDDKVNEGVRQAVGWPGPCCISFHRLELADEELAGIGAANGSDWCAWALLELEHERF